MRVNYMQPIMGLSLLATVHQLHNLDVAQAAMDACSDSVTRTILCVHSVHFLFKWLCCLFHGIMTASLLMGSFIRLSIICSLHSSSSTCNYWKHDIVPNVSLSFSSSDLNPVCLYIYSTPPPNNNNKKGEL